MITHKFTISAICLILLAVNSCTQYVLETNAIKQRVKTKTETNYLLEKTYNGYRNVISWKRVGTYGEKGDVNEEILYTYNKYNEDISTIKITQ